MGPSDPWALICQALLKCLADRQDRKMQLPNLISGRFINRDNRFRATVLVAGQETKAHVRNSGGLRDLFATGRPVWLAPAAQAGRKTAYDLQLVALDSGLVSIDAHLPNKIFAEAVQERRLPSFPYQQINREISSGASRIDFHLAGSIAPLPGTFELPGNCWVETKSVTLVENGTALFPDVPTARGSRHLRELMNLRGKGERAAVVFIVQRADALALVPHASADPLFVQTLRAAVAAGVEARAYNCQVTLAAIQLADEIPVQLPP